MTTDLPRRLASLFLVAWLAGAGCLLGCSAATPSAHAAHSLTHAAQTDSHVARSPDSCAAMRGHDCCEGVGGGEGEEGDAPPSAGAQGHGRRGAMHCPLGRSHASDPARKVRVDSAPVASTPATRTPAPASRYAAPQAAVAGLVRDRGSTHLRCCVFLI